MIISQSVRLLGNGHFNIYLVGSGRTVVLECGVSGVVPAVARQVKENGWADQVSHLVVMHAHFDHVCGLPGMTGVFSRAETVASARAADVLARPKVVARFFHEDEAMTRTLDALAGRTHGGDAGPGRVADPPETLKVDRIIEGEEVWQLGPGLSLHFTGAPGHSPCSLMAYCPQEEVLFSSDSAGFPVDSRTVFPIFFDGYRSYVQTIKRMMDLPVSVLAGAHGEVIRGRRQVMDYLRSALDWAESTRASVEKEVGRGADQEALARQVFARFYHGRLKIYTEENIMTCSRLIVRRSIEAEERQCRP
ncbi:MAG: MBL fold metallo-hydrolase [Bacillota bacterium]